MALKIRLRQQGRTNRRSFRLVVADSRSPRDGKYVENLGLYDAHRAEGQDISINSERLTYWLNQGAEISENAKALVARAAPEVYRSLVNKELEKKAKALAKRKERKKAQAKTA